MLQCYVRLCVSCEVYGGDQNDFWAVRDVSFTVQRGEALGIIGHNGAGKSTILKPLSGITALTSGGVAINGRLSALIEVGSGFHPELTGRGNIYLNVSVLGMRRVRRVALLPEEFSIGGGELTPTLKSKRRVVNENYGGLIEELYGS